MCENGNFIDMYVLLHISLSLFVTDATFAIQFLRLLRGSRCSVKAKKKKFKMTADVKGRRSRVKFVDFHAKKWGENKVPDIFINELVTE
jgi:hypothetical protein